MAQKIDARAEAICTKWKHKYGQYDVFNCNGQYVKIVVYNPKPSVSVHCEMNKRVSHGRQDLKHRGGKCVGQLSWHFECLRLPFGSALSWPSFRWQFWRKLFEMLWQRRRCKCIHLPTVSKNRCFYRMAYTMSIFLRMETFCKFFIELFYSRSNELLLWLIQKDKLDQVISTDYIVKYLTLSV